MTRRKQWILVASVVAAVAVATLARLGSRAQPSARDAHASAPLHTESSGALAEANDDRSTPPPVPWRVRGVVVFDRTQLDSSTVTVVAGTTENLRIECARCAIDALGGFVIDIPEATAQNRVAVRAEARGPKGEFYCSYPHSVAGETDAVVLRLTRGAVISARAVTKGQPVGNATFLVSEEPVTYVRPVVTHADLDGNTYADALLSADGDGRIQAAVREGYVTVRAAGAAGVYGPAIRTRVRPGDQVELGDLEVGVDTLEFRIHVVDTERRPVEAAAVRVADRSLRLFHPAGENDHFHLRLSESGETTITVPTHALPMRVAAASDSCFPGECEIHPGDALPGVVELTLRRRPGFEVRLQTPTGTAVDVHAQWAVESAARDGNEEVPGDVGEITPVTYFEQYYSDVTTVERGGGLHSFFTNAPGRYRVHCLVAGGLCFAGEAQAKVEDRNVMAITIPDGRPVQLRLTPQAFTSFHRYRLVWLPQADIEWQWNAKPGETSEVLWLPSSYDAVRVEPADGTPAESDEHAVPQQGPTQIEIAPRLSRQVGVLDVVGTREGTPVETTGIRIMVSGRAAEGPFMFPVVLGREGTLLLSPGRYGVALFPGAGALRWEHTELAAGAHARITLDLGE